MRTIPVVSAALLGVVCFSLGYPTSVVQPADPERTARVGATRMMQAQPACFVPNQGQWEHAARFVRRSGAMTVFLEDHGWVVALEERPASADSNLPGRPDPRQRLAQREVSRGAAVRMSFLGSNPATEMVGEGELPGHSNYFLGSDESRWRTHVPRYSSVVYREMYPGVDVRLRENDGHLEYDLLCASGADLTDLVVEAAGADKLSIAGDGSLVIDTQIGPITQPRPKTWECLPDGSRRVVWCDYLLLGDRCFGFVAPGWSGVHSLVIDPGLLWSTFLGGGSTDSPWWALAVGEAGRVTVGGETSSPAFPTTLGAYDTTYSTRPRDSFVSQFDPSKTGAAQLVYSTFLGGQGDEFVAGLSVDASGIVTVAGGSSSPGYPTSAGAYSTTLNSSTDVVVTRLDPSKSGSAQLLYSTFVGSAGSEWANAVVADANGIVTFVGTGGLGYPVTTGAYDTSFNGGNYDAIVSRLDPTKIGAAQLVYSSFLGGGSFDRADGVHVNTAGVITVAGSTSGPFPTTTGAYDTTHNGLSDVFVSQLDPSAVGSAQLRYSSYVGGASNDVAWSLGVDRAEATLWGTTASVGYPKTPNAYDASYNGGGDVFVTRLLMLPIGRIGLVYSTYLGGSGLDTGYAMSVDGSGVVTAAGTTSSVDFPTTVGAYGTTINGGYDAFVLRLDPSQIGAAQLRYSTYLGGANNEDSRAVAVDGSGVAIVTGFTTSANFPTSLGAFDTTPNGSNDVFLSRLDMGVAMWADTHLLALKQAGTQTLTLNAGKVHASRLYWVFGSITGTSPGSQLLGVHVPLNFDPYTEFTIGNANTPLLKSTRGQLDANGGATASFNVPANAPAVAGFTLHHAYVVYDANGAFYMASNAVPLRLR